LKQRSIDTILSWKETVQKITAKGKERGEIRETADSCAFSNIFIALIEGGIMLAKATGKLKMLNDCVDRIEYMIDTELAV
jgi:TetR/AcrR family transcriptional regulator, transcriptional repressor for nem operon